MTFEILHAGQMLDRARNTDRDIELRRHDLAGLADLPVVRRVAGVDRGARGAHRRPELVGYRLDVGLEVLRLLHRPAARDDDLGGRELRPVGLGERIADEGGDARVRGGRHGLDGGRAAGAGSSEGGGAHGDQDLRIGRLDRLDGVAGINRPLESLGPENPGDVGDLHHVEEGRDPRSDVLRVRGRQRDDRVIGRGERDDERGCRLGERMGVEKIVGDAHPGDARELRGRLGRRADVVADDQNVDRLPDLEGGGEGARGQIAQGAARDLGQKKGRHDQITPASSCSLATSSATDLTFTPALRPPGSDVLRTLSRGATSTP